MFKKIISILMVATMLFSILALAGCSKKDDETSEGNTINTEESTTAVASTEKVKITYSIWGSADEGTVAQENADKFNTSQDRIEVEVVAIPWETYMTKLNTMATAGELPDCGMLQEGSVIQWSTQDMLADVSAMYEGATSAPLESLTYTYNGKAVSYAGANEVLLLYYNKDLFDAAGVAYPPASVDDAWSWDEFVATAKKLTIDKNGKNPTDDGFDAQNITQYGALVENLAWQLETWPISNGAGYYDEQGNVIIDNPASIEAIQKIADLYLVDHVAPLSIGVTDDSIQRSIISGTVAMGTGGQWNIGTCLNSAKEEGLNYGVAVLPYMKEKVTLNTGSPLVVFNQSKHKKEAMEYVAWLYKEENSWSLISSGIWMPILEEYYIDEAFTRKWVENPNFPPYEEYKSAVVDYALTTAKPASWFYVNNTSDFNALVTSILGDVWTGNTTAEKAINDNIDALKAASAGQ